MINYDELDPGIRRLVRLLNDWGWPTTDSGDGKTKGENGADFPHVIVSCDCPVSFVADYSHTLLERLKAALKPEARKKLERVQEGDCGDDMTIYATLEVSYSPIDETTILSLVGICDDDLAEDA